MMMESAPMFGHTAAVVLLHEESNQMSANVNVIIVIVLGFDRTIHVWRGIPLDGHSMKFILLASKQVCC